MVVVVVSAVRLFQGSHLSSVGGARQVRCEMSAVPTEMLPLGINYQYCSSPTSNRSITECKPHPCLRGTERKREQKRWGKRGFSAGRQKRNVLHSRTWGCILVPQPSSAATPPLCEGSTQKHATPEGAIEIKPLKRQLSRSLGDGVGGPLRQAGSESVCTCGESV